MVKIQILNGASAEETKSLVMSIAKVKSVSYAGEGLFIIAEVAASNLHKLERMKKEQKIVAMEFAEAG